jgi:diguanylate cyclase (GGDEF)-like protein
MNNRDKPVILIVDDSRVVRLSLKNILKNDCQLIEAEDGRQAWELLLESPNIRLIFSDLSMPRLDGRGLLQKIRNSEINRIRNTPFIVVTGNEDESSVRGELQDMGATEVVSKPFDPARIVSFVSTLVSQQENESYMLLAEEDHQTEHLPDLLKQKDFMVSASKELSFAIRNKNELAIALLRIDQFDQLESHYSQPAIEHILMTTAEIILQHIHPDDIIAYFGGGLFAMLRPASNAIGTRYIGRRITEDLTAKQFYLGESGDVVSASIGISAPQIKPGIRLKELILLAEGRLKAAIDLGGNRVIDKGNDTLLPVAPPSDSAPGMTAETEFTSSLHNDCIKSSYLRLGGASELAESRLANQTQDLEEKIGKQQSQIQSLGQENRDLQNQVERLRKQSGESEQLRRRVFELESEQQQMQLKLNELSFNNHEMKKRAETAEAAHKQLFENEEEKSITLKQANQFYEQENIQLQGQLEALNNRAQKAELAQRRSEQLVISLKDNIKLLRAQMEQMQNQLVEAQQQTTQAALSPVVNAALDRPPEDVDTAPLLDEDTHIEKPSSDNDLIIDGFPSSKPLPAADTPAPVVHLFNEPEVPDRREKAQSRLAPSPSIEPERPNLSIPVYRPETREKESRQRRPLSSFTIASLILFLLLALGGGYLYYYWENDPRPVKAQAGTTAEQGSDKAGGIESTAARSAMASQASNQRAETSHKPATAPMAQAPAANPQPSVTTDEKARLQAEHTLRQIAEEEFKQRLHQADHRDEQLAPPIDNGSGGFADAGEVEAVQGPAREQTN